MLMEPNWKKQSNDLSNSEGVLVPVADITDDFPIGPTLHLSNEPVDVQFTIPWEWVRYVLRIPEGEGKFTFALGFA
jgi:hypothetical protein